MTMCGTCKDAGTVWAPAHNLPRGFKIFCGAFLNRTEDRQHVEICPSCNGRNRACGEKVSEK